MIVRPGPAYGPQPFAANEDPAARALEAIVSDPRISDLRVSTWLAVRRLLEYLLPGNLSQSARRGSDSDPDPLEASMLAYLPQVRSREETRGEGVVRRIEVYRQFEGHFGF